MIYVTGHLGRVGSTLLRLYPDKCLPFTLNPELECDITNIEMIDETMDVLNPEVIINCAAVTAVDECQKDEVFAHALDVNVGGVSNLLAVTGKFCRVVHLSTDYVFPGTEGPYTEDDMPIWDGMRQIDGPVNNYGWSKLGGEIIMMNELIEGNTVVRTTGLFGSGKPDFATWLVQELTQSRAVNITRELIGNHTYVPHLAEALVYICEHKLGLKILHVASENVGSRHLFALLLAEEFGLDKSLLTAVTSEEISGWIAERPYHGGLNTTYTKGLGVPMYSMLEGIKEWQKSLTLVS